MFYFYIYFFQGSKKQMDVTPIRQPAGGSWKVRHGREADLRLEHRRGPGLLELAGLVSKFWGHPQRLGFFF